MQLKMTELETERLLLREFRQTDAAEIDRWESAIRAESFLEFCFQSYREWGMGPWAMVHKQSGVIVGNCGFCRIRYDQSLPMLEYCGEVNYYIAPQYRAKGLATEALRAILDVGFGNIRLTRIQGRCPPTNLASERVMLKAGLKFERIIAAAAEESPDEKLFAITREDFRELSSSSSPPSKSG
jgi:ribosomal-protein-alanine N-acetyltransferase